MSGVNEKTINAMFERQKKWIENTLNGFMADLMGMKREFNLRWNAINVIVKVLLKNNLISPEDFNEAAKELLEESKANDAELKKLAGEGKNVTVDDLPHRKPVDQMVETMAGIFREDQAKNTKTEPS